jgi:hypothetical protein
MGIEIYRGFSGYQIHHLSIGAWWPDGAVLDLEEIETLLDGYEGVGRLSANPPS